MSIYDFLSMPVPSIAYCALHQAKPEIPKGEYMKTMNEFHEKVRGETTAMKGGYERFLQESVARESQILRGALSPFLHTPIRSDEEEVGRLVAESLERFKNHLGESGLGLQRSVEGRVFFPPSKKALEKRLLGNGKSYLGKLGFDLSKGKGDIYESMFVVQGALNLDMLEYIVRDSIGIYSSIHGKHLHEFDGYSYAAYNLVYTRGQMPATGELNSYVEFALFFSKPDVKYGPFREGLVDAFEKLCLDLALDHLTLWQRKLGLGKGEEFVLRIVCDKADKIVQSVEWLSLYDEHNFVKQALTEEGSLVVKELLF